MLEAYQIYFTNVFDIGHIMQMLIVSITTVFSFYRLKKDTKNILIGLAHLLGFFAVFTLLDSTMFSLSNIVQGLRGSNFLISYTISAFLYIIFFGKQKSRARIITGSFVMSVCLIVTSCLTELAYIPRGLSDGLVAFILILLACLALSALVLTHLFPMEKYDEDISQRITVLFIISAAVIVIVCYLEKVIAVIMEVGLDFASQEQAFNGTSGCALLILVIVSYITLHFICERNREYRLLEAKNQNIEASLEMYSVNRKALSQMKKIVHDEKNRLSYITMLLETEQYDTLKEYMKSVTEEVLLPATYVDAGNKGVSYILSMESIKANNKNISLHTNLNVPPVIPFTDNDMVSLLTNMIDNAIEATEKIEKENGEKKIIDVTISIRQDFLYVGVVNEIAKGVDESRIMTLMTTKSDTINHGFGTQILKDIAEKYNGYTNFSVQNHKFYAEAMLDLMYKKGDNKNV